MDTQLIKFKIELAGKLQLHNVLVGKAKNRK